MPKRVILPATFVVAALYSGLAAYWSARFIENRSDQAVREALDTAGYDWAGIESDGLRMTLSGTAPSEAARFRAIAVAGGVVDAARVTDAIEVAPGREISLPEFSVEILRNEEGISLIGLVPADPARETIVTRIGRLVETGNLADMMESADYPVPDGWEPALGFALDALEKLPQAKISVTAEQVTIAALAASPEEKRRIETDLARAAPKGMRLALQVNAPRPVIAPFALRFVIDAAGARFDACSADSDKARARILAAASKAGATGQADCLIGLGVPTPEWAAAVEQGIGALARLGAGSITYSDADVSLIAADSVEQDLFDTVAGDLETTLPEVFSLHAVLTEKPAETASAEGPPRFTAILSPEGRVELRGRVPDERQRGAVESFARARFGMDAVYAATRLDAELPDGWPLRILTALDALGSLASGSMVVEPALVTVAGVTGDKEANDKIARLLAEKLGDASEFKLEIRYEPKLDPTLGLPTPEQCATRLNAILAGSKINFEPGNATISGDAAATLDELAAQMKQCTDFPMEIGGHTDSQGREEMNLNLSQQRAEAVVAALMARRVLTGNLAARGYGETRPIAENDTEAGREANRRIEFRLLDLAEATATGEEEEAEMSAEDGGAEQIDAPPEPGLAPPDFSGADEGSGDGDPSATEEEEPESPPSAASEEEAGEAPIAEGPDLPRVQPRPRPERGQKTE